LIQNEGCPIRSWTWVAAEQRSRRSTVLIYWRPNGHMNDDLLSYSRLFDKLFVSSAGSKVDWPRLRVIAGTFSLPMPCPRFRPVCCSTPLARHRPPKLSPHSISSLNPFGLRLDSLSHSFGLSPDLILRLSSSHNPPRCSFDFISLSISYRARSTVPVSTGAKRFHFGSTRSCPIAAPAWAHRRPGYL
jgi:hypothetical protein